MDHTRPLVLVIDDDGGVCALLSALLEDEGYAVHTSGDGAAALASLGHEGAQPPDLILLDMRMPVMDGHAFARAYLAANSQPAPIVLLSGDVRSQEEVPWAAARIAKPFDLERLLDVVSRTLAPH